MATFYIEGLSRDASMAVNQAMELANNYSSSSVDTSHLAYVLLGRQEVASLFRSETSTDVEKFRGLVLRVIGKHREQNFEDIELGVDDIEDELRTVIATSIMNATEDGKTSCVDMYRTLIGVDGTIFRGLMVLYGIDVSKLEHDVRNKRLVVIPKYSRDLNKMASRNELDPMESRDDIVDGVIEILGRRQKGNPVLIGEPGVGKTAIIEGLAQRIESGNVPSYLSGTRIMELDITSIVAGCKFRGDFEDRFNSILEEAKQHKDVILFIDEFHTLVGAGSTADNSLSASSILKPALARGELRIIGATTTKEYRNSVANDSAFERRLQTILVDEPTVEDAIKMIKKIKHIYSDYHNAAISNAVIEETVSLSDRYITDRRLPDKAITVIDETAARLKAYSGDKEVKIKISDIKYTISKLVGIDIKDMGKSDKAKLLKLESRLSEKVIGQKQAIEDVSKAIKRNKSAIRVTERPVGSFLFVGPTGVGKTELAKELARELFGSDRSIIRIDMSEYMEKHSVSRLIGAPPGYVGYDQGGQLTDAVKSKPYSIILLDEIEKAHEDVFNIFLQVMDDGRLTDSRGYTVDFKNTIIIMTSNAGYGAIERNKRAVGFNTSDNADVKVADNVAIKSLEGTFRPEFLNRLDKVVVFNSLNDKDISKIVKLMLKEVANNLSSSGITIKFSGKLIDTIAKNGYDSKYGARNIRREIQNTVEDYLADILLRDLIKSGDIIKLDMLDGSISYSKCTVVEVCNI